MLNHIEEIKSITKEFRKNLKISVVLALIILVIIISSIFFNIGYKKGYNSGFLKGMGAEREIIETDIANGAIANRTCQEINNAITCKVTWTFLPDPKNATEQRQRYGLK